jgi:hypothetical protein
MARFDTTGFDDVINGMIKLGEGIGETADKMLLAGAQEVKASWKKTAEKHKFRDTGDMINSIGYARKPKSISGIRQIDIYPQGEDRHGVRNAEKAFILHYGMSAKAARKIRRGKVKKFPEAGIPATHWVDEADADASPRVQAVMEKEYDNLLRKKGKL